MAAKGSTYKASPKQIAQLAEAKKLSPPFDGKKMRALRTAKDRQVAKFHRNRQVRQRVLRYVKISDLKDLRFRPVLKTLAQVSILLERSYEHLRTREDLLGNTGELCRSIETVRRLADTQLRLLQACGLVPTATLPEGSIDDDAGIEDAFQRMQKIRVIRDNEKFIDGEVSKEDGDES